MMSLIDIIGFLIILIFIITIARMAISGTETVTTYERFDDEPDMNIVGNLRVQVDEGMQDFVIDPVDYKKIFVNSNDDRYEDASGRIWRLVRK